MASDNYKMQFGDSARNWLDSKSVNSNHIFDGAGENIQYHSDSESQGSKKSKTRYINPAIYIETIEAAHSVTSLTNSSSFEDVTPHPHSSYRSNSTPFLSGSVSSCSTGNIKRKSCRLIGNGTVTDENTPRFDRTYREDGPDTFRLSVASLSTTTTAKEERERNEQKRQDAFQQWCARKDQERRERARQEKMKMNMHVVPMTSQEQREAAYRLWLDRKRTENERIKAEEIMRQFRDNEHYERVRNKRDREKEEKLNEWVKKKEEVLKITKTREERKAARMACEEQRRRANNERAYRDWLRTSRNKPLPVPLNQGELSMRGSVSQMYINPIPWQAPT